MGVRVRTEGRAMPLISQEISLARLLIVSSLGPRPAFCSLVRGVAVKAHMRRDRYGRDLRSDGMAWHGLMLRLQ